MVFKNSRWPLTKIFGTMCQPRRKTIKKITDVVYGVEDLKGWHEKLVLGAEEAHRQAEMPADQRTYTVGRWCYFCKARAVCRANREAEEARRMKKEATEPPAATTGCR